MQIIDIYPLRPNTIQYDNHRLKIQKDRPGSPTALRTDTNTHTR
jgi:hypothetical protein